MFERLPLVPTENELPTPLERPDWVKVQLAGCNLRCSFCSQDTWREPHRRGVTTWLASLRHNVLDQLPHLRLLIVTGGEPLMSHSAVRELLEWCQDHGTESGIFTNCTLMSAKRATELSTLGLGWVRTTLNGHRADIHEESYPHRSFDRTVAGIEHAQAAGIPVKVRSTVTASNQHHLAELATFIASLGVRELDLRPYMPLGDCNPHEDNILDPAHLIRATATLLALAEQWAASLPGFRFIPVLSEPAAEDAWQGRTGLVHHAVIEDLPDLSGYQVYACGAPVMVESAQRDFTAHHKLPEDEFYADSFTSAADLANPV